MRFLPLPGVFQPHSDSRLLAELIAREPLRPGSRVLDLCTGSGILAIAAASHPGVEATAVDVSRRAVLAARLNARLNGVSLRAVRGDLLRAVPGERFDLIVSNPPYLPGPSIPRRGASRAWEGGPGGRVLIDRICAEAPGHLTGSGVLLLVHSEVCSEQATLDALAAHGLCASVAARHRGPPGPLLRERRLLGAREEEEMIFFRAERVGG